MRRALVILLASLTALAPATAQQSDAPRTYTVREGDTLWAIAERLLKDPFRWADLHKKNAEKIRDPHWIYPGQVIDLVDLFGAALDSTAVDTATVPANEPSIFAVRRAAPARVAVSAPVEAAASPRLSRALGEFAAAPFLAGLDGVRAVGTVGPVADSGLGIRSSRYTRAIQLYDQVRLALPAGAAVVDARFVTYRYGPTLRRRGRIVIPTGVVRVTGVGQGGLVEAELTAKFEDVSSGQALIPLDTVLPTLPSAAPVTAGPTVTVLWVEGDALIPSMGQALIVSPPSDGVTLRPGDQVTLSGRAMAGESEPVVVVRVMKATAQGATARIVSQGLGRVERGMKGRVTARVP